MFEKVFQKGEVERFKPICYDVNIKIFTTKPKIKMF